MIKFENPENGRFYYLNIHRDMLDDLVLSITFGGYNIVRTRVVMCDSRENLHKTIERISKKRLRRGYVLIS